MRILVTGGRKFSDRELLFATLDRLHAEKHIALVIHGDAQGTDRLAGDWAQSRGIPVLARPADWKRYGRAVGPVPNRQMLADNPNLVVAFPGGAGTQNMIEIARKLGIPVILTDSHSAQRDTGEPSPGT